MYQQNGIYTVFYKKNITIFIFVISLSAVNRFCSFLAETYPRESGINKLCTVNHRSFYTFVLYLVKPATIFIAYSAALNILQSLYVKLSPKVKSDNHQVLATVAQYVKKLFILSEQVFKVSSNSSHTGVRPSMPRGPLPRQ